MSRSYALAILLLGLVAGSSGSVLAVDSDVPPEYQQLYSTLQGSLSEYETYLETRSSGAKYPVIFGAELLPANSNRGTELLNPQTIQAVGLFLDRFMELGVRGVTFPIHYPIYMPSFPRHQEYVQFFKQVVEEVRQRGMVVEIESAVIFANTPYTTLDISYAGLTFEKFKVERKQMIAMLVQDLHPDYLNLGAEPDTEYQLTGLRELMIPEKFTEYINYILADLDRGSTKIGAGIGTWGNIEHVKSLASKTSLDSIHTHVYPVTGNFLRNLVAITEIARQYGKKVILDEAWLYKEEDPSTESVAASPAIFMRDVFSFWAPLDQKFLEVVVKSARILNIEYISPFWTNLFFGYVDYNASTAQLSFTELTALANRIAASNIVAGKFSSTGEFYRYLITGGVTSTLTSAPATTQATLTTDSATTDIANRTGAGGLLVAAAVSITVILAILILLRRRYRKPAGMRRAEASG